MRGVQECAEQARRFVRQAAREKDPRTEEAVITSREKPPGTRPARRVPRAEVSDEALADHQERFYPAHGRGRHSLPSRRAKSGKFYPPRYPDQISSSHRDRNA